MEIVCPQCEHPNPEDAKFCKECGLQLARTQDPLIGQKIGNHRLTKRIGVGGMGVVYLAEHINLGKKYAVKFLHPQFASDEEVVERFRREAQVISQLDHENIIRETDFGWLDGVGFYLIMEYLQGDTLKDVIREGNGLTISRVIKVFEQLMDALDEAHTQSVIHRDLKPENIFIVKRKKREQLKILDFGIARVVMDGAHKDFTVDGEVYGSPTYMSPEQARGEISKVDHRADLYAVGVILVEALTGRPPYQGATPAEVMLAHISGLPPRLSDLNPDIRFAAGLEDVVLKALAKEPDERFQSAKEFWGALYPMLKKTKELQEEENETIDIPPSASAALMPSSARVLVSREWTPTPSQARPLSSEAGSLPAPSQPSLPGAPIPVPELQAHELPAPTAESHGFAGGAMIGQKEDSQWPKQPAPFLSPGQIVADTPTPAGRSLTPPAGMPEEVLLPPHPDEVPAQSQQVSQQMLDALVHMGEEEGEEDTTVSYRSNPFPIKRVSAPSPTLDQSADVGSMDALAQEDKTSRIRAEDSVIPASMATNPAAVASPTPPTPMPAVEAPAHVSRPAPSRPPAVDMNQTQSQQLPGSQPVMMSLLQHPAFLGGVVGFALLLVIWLLVPGIKAPSKGVVSDAGSETLRGSAPGVRQRQGTGIPRFPKRRPVQPAPTANAPDAGAANPAAPVKQAELVRLLIKTTPPGAGVYLKGRGKVGTTPYTLQVPKGEHIEITILKDGYQSLLVQWDPKESTEILRPLIPE